MATPDAPTTDDVAQLRATPVVGYHAELGEEAGTYKLDSDGERRRVLDFALELLGRVVEDGDVVGLHVRVTAPGSAPSERFVHAADMTGQRLPEKVLGALGQVVTSKDAHVVSAWMAQATRTAEAPTIDTLSAPRWVGDRLQVPGVNYKPSIGADGYGPRVWPDPNDEPDYESDAREAWRHVVEIAAEHPKLGLVLGACAISPFLDRLGLRPFIVHLWAESTRGKTRAARTALSVVANPDFDLVGGTWNTTFNGAMARLKKTGGMPYLLDETGVIDGRSGEDTLRRIVFAVASGQERQRADRTGAARAVERLNLVLLSTGERRLTTAAGETGTRARVIELEAPLIEDAELGDAGHDLAFEYAGWPLVWLLRQSVPTRADFDVPRFDNELLNRMAPSLAACRLGFELLAHAVGVTATLDLEAATRELVVQLEEAPVSHRLYELLWEDFCANGDRYLGDQFTGSYGRDLGDGTWAVFPKRAKDVAERNGIADVSPAMRELSKRGLLVPDANGKHLGKRVRLGGGKQTRMYVLVKPSEEAEGETTELWSQFETALS